MQIHCFQHVPFEKPGVIANWAIKNNFNLTYTKFYEEYTLPKIDEVDLLVVMGGPMSFDDYEVYTWLKAEIEYINKAIRANKAIIGICLGAQLVVQALGGKPLHGHCKEIGWFPVQFNNQELKKVGWDIFPDELNVFHWHGDTFEIPGDSVHIAQSEAFYNQAYICKDRIIGFQFHLEVKQDIINELLINCRAELRKDKYVQSENEILAGINNITATNKLMIDVLEKLRTIVSK